MRRSTRFGLTAAVSIGLAASAAVSVALKARAQSGGAYDLSWNVIASGGGASSGSAYALGGTIGQPDAGTHTGGAYKLLGGFWASGPASVTAVGGPRDGGSSAPVAFQLHPGAPNPFQRQTTIAFDLPQSASASVSVYNVSGALVRTLLDGPIAAGRHAVSWEGRDDRGGEVAQGVYVLRLESGSNVATRKVVLTR
ncbi:MAG: FlgD immunoglobulin-like domain containing protein [bacterium]